MKIWKYVSMPMEVSDGLIFVSKIIERVLEYWPIPLAYTNRRLIVIINTISATLNWHMSYFSVLFFPILQWYPEIKKYCPNCPIILVGCKMDLRNDIGIIHLSEGKRIPVSHDKVMYRNTILYYIYVQWCQREFSLPLVSFTIIQFIIERTWVEYVLGTYNSLQALLCSCLVRVRCMHVLSIINPIIVNALFYVYSLVLLSNVV